MRAERRYTVLLEPQEEGGFIPRATIASILRQAQLTADEFLPLL